MSAAVREVHACENRAAATTKGLATTGVLVNTFLQKKKIHGPHNLSPICGVVEHCGVYDLLLYYTYYNTAPAATLDTAIAALTYIIIILYTLLVINMYYIIHFGNYYFFKYSFNILSSSLY